MAHEPELTVLVVDDDPDARAWLSQGLSAAGLRVICADSGDAALARIADLPVDAVLLDVMMHGLDGFATCERLRERDDATPVIFMTGLGETEHVLRGFAAGGNDYVTKPLALPEVIARVQAHARTARRSRSVRSAIESSDRAMLAMDGERVAWANAALRRLLAASDTCPIGANPPPCWSTATDGLAELAAVLTPWQAGAERHRPIVFTWGRRALRARPLSGDDSLTPVLTVEPADSAAGVPVPLTARESEVLSWVARGKTNRDIAEILGMSPRTVNKHLEHIFEKLGVETRTAAANVAQRLGIDRAGAE